MTLHFATPESKSKPPLLPQAGEVTDVLSLAVLGVHELAYEVSLRHLEHHAEEPEFKAAETFRVRRSPLHESCIATRLFPRISRMYTTRAKVITNIIFEVYLR